MYVIVCCRIPYVVYPSAFSGGNIDIPRFPPFTMVRLRTYGRVTASPGGRSFYSNPRKRTRRAKAPITPALKELLAKQRETRRAEYTSSLKDARDTVQKYATQLRETFGSHSVEYYTQEILQRGRLERSRRKPSRWNAYLRHELNARNSGTEITIPFITTGTNKHWGQGVIYPSDTC